MTIPIRPDCCFQLRIGHATGRAIVIRAYDHNARMQDSHNHVDIEVRHGGKVIFPLGLLYVGIPKAFGDSTDGVYAKNAVLSCVAMGLSAGGSTRDPHHASYTPEQLAWCERYGEDIDMEREARYCDENGNLRRMGGE